MPDTPEDIQTRKIAYWKLNDKYQSTNDKRMSNNKIQMTKLALNFVLCDLSLFCALDFVICH